MVNNSQQLSHLGLQDGSRIRNYVFEPVKKLHYKLFANVTPLEAWFASRIS